SSAAATDTATCWIYSLSLHDALPICTRYTLSALASVGTSKSGAVTNVSTPADVMLNLVASAPPVIENVTVCAGRSPSVAVTVVTAVVFSGTLAEAHNAKAESWSPTAVPVTDRLCMFVPPSTSSAISSITLHVALPMSVGTSKSGAVTNVSTPADVMLNLVASAPPVIENVTVCAGRSPSVAVTVVTAVVFSGT